MFPHFKIICAFNMAIFWCLDIQFLWKNSHQSQWLHLLQVDRQNQKTAIKAQVQFSNVYFHKWLMLLLDWNCSTEENETLDLHMLFSYDGHCHWTTYNSDEKHTTVMNQSARWRSDGWSICIMDNCLPQDGTEAATKVYPEMICLGSVTPQVHSPGIIYLCKLVVPNQISHDPFRFHFEAFLKEMVNDNGNVVYPSATLWSLLQHAIWYFTCMMFSLNYLRP